MKRGLIIAVNCTLVVVIVLVILATWMPAIYTSESFQNSHWVRVHLLHNETLDGKPIHDPN